MRERVREREREIERERENLGSILSWKAWEDLLVPVSGISDERRGDPDVPHSARPDVHRQLHPGEVLSSFFPFVSLCLAFITSKAHRHSIRTLLHNL